MDTKLTSLEVIGMAVRSEEDAAKFYGHIARMIDNETVKTKYLHLAKEESTHRRLLVDLYKQLASASGKPPKIPGSPETAEGAEIPEEIAGSLEDLLRLAIQREKEAQAFYRKAAESATDLSGKRILEYLVRVEKGHEDMLEAELDAYLMDKSWYTGADEPGLIHTGP